jgi:hypothetical protein
VVRSCEADTGHTFSDLVPRLRVLPLRQGLFVKEGGQSALLACHP